MDGVISAAARVAKVHLRNDDDMVDRMHHRYTVLFLVIFTAVVSTTQYVGDPISCWCPAYFTENHVDYTNKVLRPISPLQSHHFDYNECVIMSVFVRTALSQAIKINFKIYNFCLAIIDFCTVLSLLLRLIIEEERFHF